MASKDIAILSQWLECIILSIHQYNMHILHKPGPDLYIVDWQFHHNHTKNRDQEIAGMSISIHTISTATGILVCTSIEEIRNVRSIDAELQMLQIHIIRGWLQNKDNFVPSLGRYWSMRLDLPVIDGVAINGK